MPNYVDAESVMEKISNLENQLKVIREEKQNLTIEIENYRQFVSSIPAHLPDGSPVISCYGWLAWAKEKLGYDNKPD